MESSEYFTDYHRKPIIDGGLYKDLWQGSKIRVNLYIISKQGEKWRAIRHDGEVSELAYPSFSCGCRENNTTDPTDLIHIPQKRIKGFLRQFREKKAALEGAIDFLSPFAQTQPTCTSEEIREAVLWGLDGSLEQDLPGINAKVET